MWLDGSTEGGPAFSVLFCVDAISTSLLCLAIIFSSAAQALAIRPTSHIGLIRKELWFICILSGILGVFGIIEIVSK